MFFSYKAKDQTTTALEGIIEASSKSEALALLRTKGVTVLSIEEKRSLFFKLNSISILNSVKLHEKILFTKNLSGMLKAGLSITRSLQVLEKQTKNKYFKKIIISIQDTIDKGGSFSDGISKFPKVFSSLFVAMIRAGEESGSMSKTLVEIGETLEKTYKLNKKIKSAMMYPSIIIAAIILIAVLMFIYVVPTLTKTFTEMGTELPGSTKIVIGISNLLSNHIGLLLGAVVSIGIGIYFLMKLERVKKFFDLVIVKAPVLGTLVKEVNTARTARTLSSLLSSGVPIGRAIEITHQVLQNSYYKRIMKEVQGVVEKGVPMSTVFKKNTHFYPVMMGEMIEVGEETGKLGDMLLDIALFYESEVDIKTKDLSTIIEPVLMIFIGAAVGFFAVSMLSPMYSVMDSIN